MPGTETGLSGLWRAGCGLTVSERWSWWTSRRSADRSGWCGTSAAGVAGCKDARLAPSPSRTPAIAPPRERLTTRAGRWATRQAGRGRPLGDIAGELGCSWHPVNASVRRWGEALLDADVERIAQTEALGPDKHLMWRRGRFKTKAWATGIVDVGRGQLLDIAPGRTAQAPTRWLCEQPRSWLVGIGWAVLDLAGPYRAAFNTALPHAKQVADPFHVVRLGNDAVDEVRRRVQNQTLGHRGRKDDPLYRARKLLVSASGRITDNGRVRLRGLLEAGDPHGEVRNAWHAKETLRGSYDITDPDTGDGDPFVSPGVKPTGECSVPAVTHWWTGCLGGLRQPISPEWSCR